MNHLLEKESRICWILAFFTSVRTSLYQQRSASTFLMTFNFVSKVLNLSSRYWLLRCYHWFYWKIRMKSSVYLLLAHEMKCYQQNEACGVTAHSVSYIYECKVIKKHMDKGNWQQIWKKKLLKGNQWISETNDSELTDTIWSVCHLMIIKGQENELYMCSQNIWFHIMIQ
jgi:hypothetical protein